LLAFVVLLVTARTWAGSSRFVIDDDAYLARITNACLDLHRAGKLRLLETLREQVSLKSFLCKLAPASVDKLEPTDLYERVRQGTVTVGTFYKCAQCEQWHFNGSTGFSVGPGIVSTCCHVVIGDDPDVKEGYLVAADAEGHVYPVLAVLAADTDADTCLLKIDAPKLKPLALRPSVRPGERVYCLSHPGGYYYMFTEGLVSRVNRRRNDVLDAHGEANGKLTRPLVFLNVTAEFAPGSSGAPLVDACGNVVGQVASIAEAGESIDGDSNSPASPSVPVRFCTATEEILRLIKQPRGEELGIGSSTSKRQSHPNQQKVPAQTLP
jgi:hypothetical protein